MQNEKMVPWVNEEAKAVKRVAKLMHTSLSKLMDETSRKGIHEARVSLRHWFALWPILQEDGWQDQTFENRVVKVLNNLLKKLGDVRDLDVNIKIGKNLGCHKKIIKGWKSERKKAKGKLKAFLRNTNLTTILDELDEFVRKEPVIVSEHIKGSSSENETAKKHLGLVLNSQASFTKNLASTAANTKQLHQLRLAIKRWRYLLEDFSGTSSQKLEKAQEALGKLRDLERIRPELLGKKKDIAALAKLSEDHRKLMTDVENIVGQLKEA